MREIDPGDAVPPGLAPVQPVPLTDEDRAAQAQLEKLGQKPLVPPGERPPG